MTFEEISDLVTQCEFDGYTFHVRKSEHDGWYLQATYMEPDIRTHVMEEQFTRRWPLSPQMCKSEIVGTVFKCCMTSMEHRTREAFTYRGKRIYGPHFDVDALVEIAGRVDVRKE